MKKNIILLTSQELGKTNELELGKNLMKMFLYSLCSVENYPSHIILYTDAVKLVVQESQELDHLRELEQKGVKILVCGTCLKYFNCENNLLAGKASNMLEITELMTNNIVVNP